MPFESLRSRTGEQHRAYYVFGLAVKFSSETHGWFERGSNQLIELMA